MQLHLFRIAAVLVCATAAGADNPTPDMKAMADKVNRPVVISVPGASDVQIKKDIVYKIDGATKLALDVYVPGKNARDAKLSAVIFVHGGVGADVPVRPKEWGIYESWGRLVAASGMIGVTFNHRVGFPDPNLAQGAADVADLITFVRAHALEYQIDPDRLAMIVYSAGGPMLSVALETPRPYIRCLGAYYPILDIENTTLHKQYLSAEQLKRYSPFTYLAHADQWPPLLIARAGRDEIPELLPGLDRFIQQAISANAPVEILNHPTGPHGFDNVDSPRSREIVRCTLDFLKEHLAPK